VHGRRRFIRYAALGVALPWQALARDEAALAWESRAPMPVPVQEVYPALLGGQIHVAGGLAAAQGGSFSVTDAHQVYSIGEDRWSSAAPLPEARHHLGLAVAASTLFAFGGFSSGAAGNWSMASQSWVYRVQENAWFAGTPAPEPHAESVILAVDGLVHIVGGRLPKGSGNAGWQDHVDSRRHLVFDSDGGQWSQLAPPSVARNSAAGAVIDGQLHVLGGRTVSGSNLALLEIYDRREDRWRQAAPLPQAQGGLAAAELMGDLIALGGEYFGAEGAGVFRDVWRYLPARDVWEALPAMPTARHGLGAVSTGKLLYALGGATRVGAQGTSGALEVLTP